MQLLGRQIGSNIARVAVKTHAVISIILILG
jgi:hypothetical protein